MFALDLFNTDHERRIAEGAVDQLEQRRIDDLAMKMDELVARAKEPAYKKNPAALAALMKEFQKCKAERDSYYKVRNETTGYDSLGETGLPDVADKAAKMARLNQPGKVGTDVVTPQQRVNPNPNKGIVGHAVDWLRGKGGPGKEGPTYESKVDEGFGPVGSKALMNGNLATFMKARQASTPVTLDIGGEQFRLTPAIMNAMAKKYNDDKAAADSDPSNKDVKLIAVNNYRAFGHPDLMRKFIDAVATPETTPPAGEPGEQLPMFEKSQRLQKKKSNNEPALDSSSVRDTKLSRELTKARGAYPTASSDIEALVRQELDTSERVKQDVDSVQTTNTAQDQTLAQLQTVNQQQTAQIAGLEKQLSTVAQQAQQPARVAAAPQTTPTAQTPVTTKSADIPIATDIPEPTTPRDQEIYNKVQSLEKELKDKIDAMASWNAIAQRDPQSNNELVDLRKEVDRTRKELQRQINKLTKANKEPTMVKQVPKPKALPDPNVVDVDAWEIPDMDTAQELQPIAARENTEKPTAIGQMAKNVGQGQELQKDPAYRNQVRRTQQQAAQRQQNIDKQKAGYGNDPDEFGDIPDINEGAMKEIDIMRQDVERMSDRQFYTAYGISKAAFQQKYRTLLKPALDEHGGGIGPRQHWQDLMQENKLSVGDPIVVTGPNEFEGKTGEIYEFSPSGTFVIVDLYNHGKHSMHLSDIEYNEYADQEADEEDDWYDDELDESANPKLDQLIKMIQSGKITAASLKDPALRPRLTQLVQQADPQADIAQLVATYAPAAQVNATNVNDLKSAARRGVVNAPYPTTSASAPTYAQQHSTFEGWSDAMVSRRTGTPRTPYSVYIKGKKWKDFSNDDHARAVMDKLKAKFKAEGRDPSVITIAPTDMSEGLKSTLAGAALAGAMAVGAGGAHARVAGDYVDNPDINRLTGKPNVTQTAQSNQVKPSGFSQEYLQSVVNGTHPRPMISKAQAQQLLTQMAAPSHPKVSPYSDDASTLKVYKPEQYKEAKADPTGSWVVYNGNKVVKFKTHIGAKAYAEKTGGKVASSEFYADRIKKPGVTETALNPRDPKGDYEAKRQALHDLSLNKDVDQAAVQQRRLDLDREAKAKGVKEGIVASGPSKPLDDRAVRKMVWDTMKINADTGEQAIQRALAVLAKKPQSRMVQDLQDKFQSLADRLAQGVVEGVMSNLHTDLANVYNRMAPGIERNRDSFKAGQLYDALEAVAEQHGAEAEFKRMMTNARNSAHMDYDTNPGGFQNWFWYLPFAEEDVAEGLMKEPTNRKEYLDQRDKLFRMMAVDSNPANKQIIKQALQDLEARYGNLKKAVKEEFNTDSEAVERAILNRIMVAHTDLLMKFGPDKVMQAAEEVAYNVGDVDEIGTSDISAYVHQVKQILGVPEEVNEKWSQKYKSSINCANPKGFSQKAHCASKKK
jgi:hypothetical protein